MSRRELLATHTNDELTEWMAYEALEPFGADATDVRFGLLTAVVANANRDPKKSKPVTIDQARLGNTPAPSPEELNAKILTAFGIS